MIDATSGVYGFDPGRFLPASRPPRILCVRLSALGDVVNALPAAAAIRAAFPGAFIGWLVETGSAALPAMHPGVDRVFVLDRKRAFGAIAAPWRMPGAAGALLRLFRGIRREGFDAALDFQGNFRSALATFLCGAVARIGFSSPRAREGSWLSYGVRVEPKPGLHRLEQNLALLSGLGLPPATQPRFDALRIPGPEREAARLGLAAAAPGARGIAFMHPGASAFGDFKRWDPERFGRTAAGIRERLGLSVLVTRGPGEEPLAAAVAAASGGAAIVAPETPSLERLAALLSEGSLFVGGDTGPTHLAAALGVPTVAVFGPKDPKIYAPRGVRVEVVRKDVPCAPCRKRACDHLTCLRALEPGSVIEACVRLASQVSSPPAPPPAG